MKMRISKLLAAAVACLNAWAQCDSHLCFLQNTRDGAPCWISADCSDSSGFYDPCGAGNVMASCSCSGTTCYVGGATDGNGTGYVYCRVTDDNGSTLCSQEAHRCR